MFHKWLSTDDPETDSCIGCGVATQPVHTGPASVDNGPLPVFCPGPGAYRDEPEHGPHHFLREDADTLRCAFCGSVIDEHTVPDTVEWDCVPC